MITVRAALTDGRQFTQRLPLAGDVTTALGTIVSKLAEFQIGQNDISRIRFDIGSTPDSYEMKLTKPLSKNERVARAAEKAKNGKAKK